jgi:CRP-like cAMP-binding protein
MSAISMSPERSTTNELYAGLTTELRNELQKYEQELEVPQGYKLIEHGVRPERLVILNSGTVEISVTSGGNEVSLGTAGPGKVFGMRAAVSGEVPEISVTALEQCELGIITGEDFANVLRNFPQIYFAVAKVLSADLKIADQLIRNCARKTPAIVRKSM